MIKPNSQSILAIALVLACSINSAVAESSITERELSIAANKKRVCLDRVQECFIESGSARNSCLFRAAAHVECTGNPIKELVQVRWSISSGLDIEPELVDQISAEEAANSSAHGLTNTVVDQSCIERFDTQFITLLLAGEPSSKQLGALRTTLDSCRSQEKPSMLVP